MKERDNFSTQVLKSNVLLSATVFYNVCFIVIVSIVNGAVIITNHNSTCSVLYTYKLIVMTLSYEFMAFF